MIQKRRSFGFKAMSKFNYKKELKKSLIDASLMTAGPWGLAWIGSQVGVSKPTLAMSAENIGKIVIYLTASDMLKDYLKHEKILPSASRRSINLCGGILRNQLHVSQSLLI